MTGLLHGGVEHGFPCVVCLFGEFPPLPPSREAELQRLAASIFPWGDLTLVYLAAVPAIFNSSLTIVLIVGLVARNYREANSFASPVMMLPMVAIFVSMSEPLPHAGRWMITPVISTTLIIHDVLLTAHLRLGRQFSAGLWLPRLSTPSLMLSVAVRLFPNEQLVNPAMGTGDVQLEPQKSERSCHAAHAQCGWRAGPVLCFTAVESFAGYSAVVQHLALADLAGRLWPRKLFLIAAPRVLVWGYIGRYRWRGVLSSPLLARAQRLGSVLHCWAWA